MKLTMYKTNLYNLKYIYIYLQYSHLIQACIKNTRHLRDFSIVFIVELQSAIRNIKPSIEFDLYET